MDGSKNHGLRCQIERFRARFAQSSESALSDVVPGAVLRQCLDEEAGAGRNRRYPPLQTLSLFIEQVLAEDQSCQDAVARGLSARVARGEAPCSLNTGPYCKARQRLPLGLIQRLARETGARLRQGQPGRWRWQGREVKLVDGSTVSMPDTAANQAQFPQSGVQKPGLGFPVARLLAVVSLSCGAVLEWAVGPCEGKESGETALLWELSDRFRRGDVVVADRYYAGYFLIARLLATGADVVIRQHQRRRTDFRRGSRMGKRDHVVTWPRPQRPSWMDDATYAQTPETLSMREVGMGKLDVVTSLLDPRQASRDELLTLYRSRWQLELDLRAIKTVMQMDILRCHSPAMVEKEVAVHLLAYNLVRAVMAQAAARAHVLPRQLSFKAALQLLRAFEETLRHAPNRRRGICQAHLLGAIAQARLPHRPGRVEPRAKKRRPTNYPLLTKPRNTARRELIKEQIAALQVMLR